jgi:hypothetical protein
MDELKLVPFVPLDQSLRQTQPRTQHPLAPRHSAAVDFMVVPSQMKQSMQNQYLDFNSERMPLFTGLAQRRWNADGEIAGNPHPRSLGSRKRQHIGRFVDPAKLPIQLANGFIRGEKHRDLAPQTHSGLRTAKKLRERARGRQAMCSRLAAPDGKN